MTLGKRPRNPTMQRTTSMAGINVDVPNAAAAVDDDPPPPHNPLHHEFPNANIVGYVYDTPFLRSCFRCKRRLAPGRCDIYMYRGDGYCRLECREKQITEDKSKEKQSITSSSTAAVAATSNSKASTETDQPAFLLFEL